ncbi:E3 ubiquitin-protein ligase ARI3, partial [Aphelenchoides avenae]
CKFEDCGFARGNTEHGTEPVLLLPAVPVTFCRSEQINERKCPVCKESQLKNDHDGSCNKTTCKCGATYCYLCLEPDIRYDHFKKDQKDGCQLFEDAEEFDRKRLAQLQQQLDALMLR